MPTTSYPKGHVEVSTRGRSTAKNLLLILSSLTVIVLLSITSLAQQGMLTDDTSYPKSGAPGGPGGGPPGGGQTTQSELTLKVKGPGAATGAATAFIKFKLTGSMPVNVGDLPSGTPGGHVARATLKLFVSGVGTAGWFDLYRVTSPWTEGGAAAPAYDAASPVLTGVQVSAAGAYVTLDITTLVRQWLDYDPNNPAAGGYPNYGLALVASAAAPNTSVEFDSKEATQTSHQAQLGVVLSHAQTADQATNADHAAAADNAAAVTDGVYVTGSYADPPWITSLAGGKISGPVGEAAHATSADNAVTANVANSLSAGAVVPGSQVNGDIPGRASSITGTIPGGQVSGPVAEASHAASADNAANALNAVNATTADAARGVVSAAGDADISSPAAGQLYFNTTLKVFRQYDGTVWKSVDAGLAAQLSSAGTLNAPANPVDWTQLKNVPASAANGYTAGGGIQIDAAGVISNAGVLTVGAAGPLSTSGGAQNPTVSLTGVVPVANGGTGLSSAGAAGSFLRSDGSSWTSAPLTAADAPAGSASYVQNSTAQQPGNFNISGDGTAGGTLSANAINAATQYNLAGVRVLELKDDNFFAGPQAGVSNTSGSYNSYFGTQAGNSNTSGFGNSFFGMMSGRANTTGSRNAFFGAFAGDNNDMENNSFFGAFAGHLNTAGFSNSFFGAFSGEKNTGGHSNSFFGAQAGQNNTTGVNNTIFGYNAGLVNTAGSHNTFVGSNAGGGTTVEGGNVFVGANAGGVPGVELSAAIGVNAQVTQSNSVVIGSVSGVNGAITTVNVGIGTTAPSERLEVVGNVKIGGPGNGLIFPDGTTLLTAPAANPVAADLNCAGCVSESELDFNPATQAKLDAHKSSADHDSRYVPRTGGTMTGALSLPSGGLNVAGSELTVTGGNVGIGTASPAAKLDVEGVARLRYVIATQQDAGLEGGEVSLQGAPGFHSWQMDNYGGAFRLHAQGVSRFEVTNSGNVGIGTGAPSQKLEVVGNLRVNGNFVATGLKSAVVTLPDNREVALYAVESPGNWFEDFGHATLNGGVAHVELDPTFAQTVNTEMTYHVFLTPNGNCNGLYVARKTATGFEVRELGGGQTNAAFDYRVVARRKGYENVTSRVR